MAATAQENTLISSGTRRIDGKTVGNNAIFTTSSTDGVFHPLFVRFSVEAATALTVHPTVSIGTNSPNFDNIYSATLSGLGTTGYMKNIELSSVISEITTSTPIYFRVSTGATATTYLLNVSIIGDYEPYVDKQYSATATAALRYGTYYYNIGDVFTISEGDVASYTDLITLGEEVAS